jgi:aspartyl-tRNA(Asn)/glutamyl-tRNA(Gln) amidotransferase subunit C
MERQDEVRKLAALARIEVTDEEVEKFAKEFDDILAYVGKIEGLQVSGEPDRLPRVRNVLREDARTHEAGAHTEALRNQFPDREGNSLKVKQIVSYD